jgi:protein-S-isoprenylcysteine O-methyltransferase Ste14
MVLMHIGVGIAGASWLYLLFTAAIWIMLNTVLPSEERYCLYRFGDEYQKYKNRTPRWIGIPKSEKGKQ